MNKNIRVRAVIIMNNGLVLMHRIRHQNNEVMEYYPLPGGGVEINESLDDALNREINEELGINIKIIKPLYEYDDGVSKQYIYLCQTDSNDIGLGNGPEYSSNEYKEKGKYLPEIIAKNELSKINIVPIELKNQLLMDINDLENAKYIKIKATLSK